MEKSSSVVQARILRKALLSRLVEERLLSLFSEGKLFGTVHTCIGQEMSGAVISEFLQPVDTVFSNHRCHGHYLSRTDDVEGLIAELMGRVTGVSGGRGGSQHLAKDGFYSNGIQGGITPVAAGLAFAHKLRGNGGISVVFIGDGTLGEGVIYEVLNIAAKWELPLLVVLEDNGYAQSTSRDETLAGSITARAEAFGLRTGHANTWNWNELHGAAEKLITDIRGKGAPGFLLIDTFRLKAHSKGDDSRPRSEIEPFEKRDPLNLWLESPDAKQQSLVQEVKQRIERAVEVGDAAEFASIDNENPPTDELHWTEFPLPDKRFVHALNETFHALMESRPEMLFIGEDVAGAYGGAFKVSQGLSDKFPGRVRNTPISEACIVGMGTGLALAGFRPVIEIMFGDFLGLAFDQIVNHAAKFEQMYNHQVVVDLVVRTPMGGGRGYGPTHSQTLDKHFFGVPGLRVLALNHLTDPARIYEPLLNTSCGPTLVIENKLMYGAQFKKSFAEGFRILYSNEKFPTVWIQPASPSIDVTLIGYGGTSEMLAMAADILFEKHDMIAQVLCPSQIDPFSITPFISILKAGSQILVVEEGQQFAAFGSEVFAQLAESAPHLLRNARRLTPPVHCIPASGPAERQMLPSVDSIVKACLSQRQ